MRYAGPAYRGHNPRWSFAPTSGEGAAVHGGRYNPRGTPALYLALSVEGAFLEATQGLAYKFKPLTMCSYDVDCADIVDLRTEAGRNSAGIALAEMASPWFEALSRNRRPACWAVHDRLHRQAAGIIAPSFATGAEPWMSNIVLWDWAGEGAHRVTVYDPDGRLPPGPG